MPQGGGWSSRRSTDAGLVNATPTHINITISFYRGWLVTFAAAGTGLLLGILYVWSVVKAGIPASWGWSNADMALPYSVMTVLFAAHHDPGGSAAGSTTDRASRSCWAGFSRAWGASSAGWAGRRWLAYVVGFGVVTAAGWASGTAAMTPGVGQVVPRCRRTGLIAGIVVAGFGLAPVVLAPLATWLLKVFSDHDRVGDGREGGLGDDDHPGHRDLGWWSGACRCFVRNPPEGHLVQAATARAAGRREPRTGSGVRPGAPCCGRRSSGCCSSCSSSGPPPGSCSSAWPPTSASRRLGRGRSWRWWSSPFGNSSGRILAGVVSDRIGRQWTLLGEFVCQGLVVAVLYRLSGGGGTWPVILIIVFLLGFNYGANLAVFPAACKDYFGIRSFGLNYGCLFAAFGLAGLTMPWVNGLIKDRDRIVRPLVRDHHRADGRGGRPGSGQPLSGRAERKHPRPTCLADEGSGVNGHRHDLERHLHGRHRGGREACGSLGHPCVSREVVIDAARGLRASTRAELQSTLEEPPHFWEKTPGQHPRRI